MLIINQKFVNSIKKITEIGLEMSESKEWDVIVVGAGHAGCEAAHISSKLGYKTLLITNDITKIGEMSCNPSIGGIGKGQLVKEISALGGHIAEITDASTIHFRMLNKSKGVAMHSPRAQCDRMKYARLWREKLESQKNLLILQEIINEIKLDSYGNCIGVQGKFRGVLFSKKVILTCGTFLNGKVHIGLKQEPGGRINELSINRLSEQIEELGHRRHRFKTGTSPRIDLRTIDINKMDEQKSDEWVFPFSVWNGIPYRAYNHKSCYVNYTNEYTHEIIKENLNKSPLYQKVIDAIGPRYCPCIEDKVHIFSDRTKHQIFIEPEGIDTELGYINGFSCSLPYNIQELALKTIPGFKNVHIVKPGYAIEYDYFNPVDLNINLESKIIPNLFFAGQLNGTTGYEEAAAQGIIAGINAVRSIENTSPLVLSRQDAYIGVLIDDLVMRGVDEPYRMFTSRAENRLNLRADNADRRLYKYGKEFHTLSKRQINIKIEKIDRINKIRSKLEKLYIEPDKINPYLKEKNLLPVKQKIKIINLIRRPEIKLNNIIDYLNINFFGGGVSKSQLEVMIHNVDWDIKYQPYIQKNNLILNKIENNINIKIKEENLDRSWNEISFELRDKLVAYKPSTIKDLKNIPGIKIGEIEKILRLHT